MVGKAMTQAFAVIVVALFLSGCSHTPLRPFDCKAVLGLRLGQSPDEVRALLGKPAEESAQQVSWESEQLAADYRMQFEDQDAAWMTGSIDLFWVEFLKNRLVKASAIRVDHSEAYAENVALSPGSRSYGQPSLTNNNRPEPVEARIGPAFGKIFQCSPEGELTTARQAFEGQITR